MPELSCNNHGFCNGHCNCTCDAGWYGENCSRFCVGSGCELLVRYTLDESPVDSQRQSSAVVHGASCSSDRNHHQGAYLFFAQDRIVVRKHDASWGKMDAFTACAWVQQLGGTVGTLFSMGNADQNSPRSMALQLGLSTILFEWSQADVFTATANVATWQANISDSNWHFVALVIEWPHATLYIDGALIGVQEMSSPIADTSEELWLGYLHGDDTWGLRGKLDDFQLFGRALNGSEVSDLKSATTTFRQGCSGPTCGLLVKYDLDNLPVDSQHNSTALVVGPVASTDRNHVSAGAFLFHRYDRIAISMANAPWDLTSAFTASAWVQQQQGTSGALFSMGGPSQTSSRYLALYLGTSTVSFEWSVHASSEMEYCSWQTHVSDSNWHFVALTTEWPHATLYIDGALIGVQVASSPIADTSEQLWLGCLHGDDKSSRACNTWGLRGKLDDFQLFGRALNGSEVSDLKSATTTFRQGCSGPTCGLLVKYDLDNLPVDSQHNSTALVVGPVASTDRNHVSAGAFLFHRYDRIAISMANAPWDLTSAFTASAWVQQQQGTSGALFSMGGGFQLSSRYLALYLGTSTVSFEWKGHRSASSGSMDHCSWQTTLSDSTWRHIALAVSWPRVMLYVDGALVGEQEMHSQVVDRSANMWLGCMQGTEYSFEPCNGKGFTGKIDDFHLWSRYLSTADILGLSKQAPSIPQTLPPTRAPTLSPTSDPTHPPIAAPWPDEFGAVEPNAGMSWYCWCCCVIPVYSFVWTLQNRQILVLLLDQLLVPLLRLALRRS